MLRDGHIEIAEILMGDTATNRVMLEGQRWAEVWRT